MMSSVPTRRYAKKSSSKGKTSLNVYKLNNRKWDYVAYQSFVSEGFYFGFRFWTKFVVVSRFSAIFGAGYSVTSLACIHSLKSVNVVFNTNCAGRPCTLESAKSLAGRYITKPLNSIYFQTNKTMHLLRVYWYRNHKSINITRAVFSWVLKSNWFCVRYATRLA